MRSDFHAELPPDVARLASLRRSLSEWLEGASVEPSISAAVVLATHEAVANAVRSAHADVSVIGSRDEDRLTVVATSADAWRDTDWSEDTPHGLTLIRGLMSEVDVDPGPTRSVVRMRLAL